MNLLTKNLPLKTSAKSKSKKQKKAMGDKTFTEARYDQF
jgi:hypothetical protein